MPGRRCKRTFWKDGSASCLERADNNVGGYAYTNFSNYTYMIFMCEFHLKF